MSEIEPDSKSIEAVIAERPDIGRIFRRSSNYLILIGIVNLIDGLSAGEETIRALTQAAQVAADPVHREMTLMASMESGQL